jgi:hypothetical protein
MKKIVLMTMVLMFGLVVSAMGLNTGACTSFPFGPPAQCIGLLEPYDMGDFDANGIWQWNSSFVAEFQGWMGANVNWQTQFAPRKTTMANTPPDAARFELRRFFWPVGSHHLTTDVRIVFTPTETTLSPSIWRVVGPSPAYSLEGYFLINLQDPMDPTNSPPKMYAYESKQITKDRINRVEWVEEAVSAEQIQDYNYSNKNVPYKLSPTNFWDFSGSWLQPDRWNLRAHFPDGIVPDQDRDQTFNIYYDGNKQLQLQFHVTDTRIMPCIRQSDIKAKLMEKDGVKLTWDIPPFKEIMQPNIELNVYAGTAWRSNLTLDFDDDFYIINVPSQMSNLYIPLANWNDIVEHVEGVPEIGIMYRLNVPSQAFGTTYQNRGLSDPVRLR